MHSVSFKYLPKLIPTTALNKLITFIRRAYEWSVARGTQRRVCFPLGCLSQREINLFLFPEAIKTNGVGMKFRQALMASRYKIKCAIIAITLIITIIILLHADAAKAPLIGTSPSAPDQLVSDNSPWDPSGILPKTAVSRRTLPRGASALRVGFVLVPLQFVLVPPLALPAKISKKKC